MNTESDKSFGVVPRYEAILITEEYVRGLAITGGSRFYPKYEEYGGRPIGVELRADNGELTGTVVEIGDYLVRGPDGLAGVDPWLFDAHYRRVDA